MGLHTSKYEKGIKKTFFFILYCNPCIPSHTRNKKSSMTWLNLNKSNQNQIKSLLLSHHHSTSALVSEILMSVLQTVQKNNRQFTYGQTVQKKQQTIYIWTDSAKNCTGAFTVLQTVQKNNNSNLHMDRQCKKATAIYIWTVHITDCTEDNVQNTHTYTSTHSVL